MIVNNKKIWYIISTTLFIGSILLIWQLGLPLGIDFTGGTVAEIKLADTTADDIRTTFRENKVEAIVQNIDNSSYLVKFSTISTTEQGSVVETPAELINTIIGEKGKVLRLESVGPTVSRDLQNKALRAMIYASIAIIIYLAYAFRTISKMIPAWALGLIAVIALIHDAVIVTGIFSLLGHYFTNITVDIYYITALLTLIGYSVNDTIVIFDRMRETLTKQHDLSFAVAAERSIQKTIARSLNTSATVLLVLLAMLALGGNTLFSFVLALILGVIIGTYSSIFIAAPLAVTWHQISLIKRK